MTKLVRLELISFGKLSDCVIELDKGLNLIYGANEAGKSTVQLFIKYMLYGAPQRTSRNTPVKDRERIIPWNEKSAKGRMIISKDGVEIEIYREFKNRASGDVVKVTYAATGENYFDGDVKGGDVGLRILGMSEQMFKRTVWIAQSGIASQGRDDEITARLINLLESGGCDDISVSAAEEELDRQIAALKAKDRRSSPGEIDKLNAERGRLAENLAKQKRLLTKTENTRNEIESLEARLEDMRREMEHLHALEKSENAKEKIARVKRLDGCMTKEMQIGNTRQFQLFKHKVKDITTERVHGYERMIDEMEAETEQLNAEVKAKEKEVEAVKGRLKGYKITTCALALLTVAALVCGIIFTLVLYEAGIAVFILTIAFFVVCVRYHKRLAALSVDMENVCRAAEASEKRKVMLEELLRAVLEELECDTVGDFDRKYALYSSDTEKIKMAHELYVELLNGDDYESLKREADSLRDFVLTETPPKGADLSQMLRENESRREQISAKSAELRNSVAREMHELVPVSDIEDNIALIDEKLYEKQMELDACILARQCLSEAYNAIKSDYTPMLNEKTEEYLSRLTGGTHGSVKVAEDFTLNLKNTDDSSDVKRAEFFSMGTYNQIYLALRLAVAALTLKAEDTVLFLDDALMSFDDERAESAIMLLRELCSENRQAVMFTCHRRDIECSKKFGDINIMEVK